MSDSEEKKKSSSLKTEVNIPPKKKAKKNRCFNCKKKLGLIPFTCKCNNNFCSKCRHAEDHSCTFNWQEYGTKKILEENPVVKPNKINKIN